MAARGRKSAASLSVVPLPVNQRSAPPDCLTPYEAKEWKAVVARMPPDWFTREMQAVLVEYCRHVVKADLVAKQLASFDPAWMADDEGLKRFDKLTQIAGRESHAIAMLATRMRLTQQSRYNAQSANTAASKGKTASKPWEFGAKT